MQSMFGQVALVTGGASGIGRAAALTFAREGAAVVVADIAEEGGGAMAQTVEDLGAESLFVRTDVLEPRSCRTWSRRRSAASAVWTRP
jgi:NAD(P)-dependent dehydrogenase (short-subunit alcohol dehydrogenase family)